MSEIIRTARPRRQRRRHREGYMSKSTIALIVTWVVIGLLLAGYGGYYYGKKMGEKAAKCEGDMIKTEAGDNSSNRDNSQDKTMESSSPSPSTSASPATKNDSNGSNQNVVK